VARLLRLGCPYLDHGPGEEKKRIATRQETKKGSATFRLKNFRFLRARRRKEDTKAGICSCPLIREGRKKRGICEAGLRR